jgi:hypothetical protein
MKYVVIDEDGQLRLASALDHLLRNAGPGGGS